MATLLQGRGAGAAGERDAAAREGTHSAAMVQIAQGSLRMGSTEGSRDERPVHDVAVAASFEMDVTEVTAAAYQRCVDGRGCEAPVNGPFCTFGKRGKENHPINCVSWDDADAFCRWVGKRLPSEEEWEHAARGPEGRKYPWGDAPPDGRVCWRRWMSKLGTCEVGSFPSGDSPFHVHDMSGNVWEWTSTVHSPGYDRPHHGALRVHRRGGWGDVNPSDFRAADRGRARPADRYDVVGFRCARSAR